MIRDFSELLLRAAAHADKILQQEEFDLTEEIRFSKKKLLELMRENRSLLKNFMGEDARNATRKKFYSEIPWTQPSPLSHEGWPPAVLHVPESEVEEFLDKVVSRYLQTLTWRWPGGIRHVVSQPEVAIPTDDRFCELLTDTPFSRFLNPHPTEAHRKLLKTQKPYWVVDLSPLVDVPTYPDVYVAGTITFLEKTPKGFVPKAILVNHEMIEPQDGAAWNLAKLFVLQGAGLLLVTAVHAMVHFPSDTINAISKALLPSHHPVAQLLHPHHYLQLPLDYAVLYIDKSVLRNDQKEIYTPFPGPFEGSVELVKKVYPGIPGNSSFPGYRFSLEAPKIHSGYGRFLEKYFQLIYEFVEKVVKTVPARDPHLAKWADAISSQIPGFPDATVLFQGDNLTRALTSYICNVSVVHSADHGAYARIPIHEVPLRLRILPPTLQQKLKPSDLTRLTTREDAFRHYMAHQMYFRPHTLQKLEDVSYPFNEPKLIKAANAFRQSLVDSDVCEETHYAPLSEIATSIQY